MQAIFDLAGRRVRALAAGAQCAAGSYTLTWDGRADTGRQVASGAYLCRLEAGGEVGTQKLLLVK